jgi:hypothetical protein
MNVHIEEISLSGMAMTSQTSTVEVVEETTELVNVCNKVESTWPTAFALRYKL